MGYISRILQGRSALANEAFGSFLFVLIGTSAITAINITGQATTAAVLLVGSLAFSVALGWIIFLLRRTGLVHINPAVTIFFWLNGQISISRTVFYIIAQLFGAISASVVVALMYGTTGVEARLGAPYPATSMGEWAAFMAELLGTLMLFATIRIAIARQYISLTQQSIIIGIGYGLGYLLAAGISGGSLNPARALGPQLTAADMTSWWLYIVAPLTSAFIAGMLFRLPQESTKFSSDISAVERYAAAPAYEDEESETITEIEDLPEDRFSDEDEALQQKAQQAIAQLKNSEAKTSLPEVTSKPTFYSPDEGEDAVENSIPATTAPSSQPDIDEISADDSEATPAKPASVKFLKYERSGDAEDE